MVDTEIFFRACRAASVLGTIQASYTHFPYMTEATKNIFEREALLGVSITGWMNNPTILFNEETLRKGAQIVKETNEKVAKILGINPAARTTAVKPSGSASVLLETASGIHGEHAKRYIRNAQMNKETEVAQLVKEFNPYMVEESVWSANGSDYVLSFPVITQPDSIYRTELYGIKLLEKVKLVQNTWVEEGTNVKYAVDSRIRHNVSNTVTVTPNMWDNIESYLFENRYSFAGISFLQASGDKDFPQAPFTEVLTEEEILEKYGVASFFASGLIVEALKVFPNLWKATSTAQFPSNSMAEDMDNQRDWIRRFTKYANNYFEGDMKKAEYALKDVYLLHKWEKITNNFRSIDFVNNLKSKQFTDVDTLAGAACAGGGCEIL